MVMRGSQRRYLQVPVPLPQQTHRGRQEDGPDDRGVEEDGHGEAQAKLADDDQAEGHEDGEDHDHDGRRAGDRAGRLGDAPSHRAMGVQAAVVPLLDPREDEHLVVHRQAEEDGEDEDGHPVLDDLAGSHAERAAEEPVLEDEDQDAVGRPRGEQVQHDRLERDDQRAEDRQQEQEAQAQDEQEDLDHAVGEDLRLIQAHGRVAGDVRGGARRLGQGLRDDGRAHVTDRLPVGRIVLRARHDEGHHGRGPVARGRDRGRSAEPGDGQAALLQPGDGRLRRGSLRVGHHDL